MNAPDGARDELDGLVAIQTVLVAALKHRHGVERAGAHGAVGQGVRGAVRVDLSGAGLGQLCTMGHRQVARHYASDYQGSSFPNKRLRSYPPQEQ